MTLYDGEITRSLDLTELLTHVHRARGEHHVRRTDEPHPLAIVLVTLGGLLISLAWAGLLLVTCLALIL